MKLHALSLAAALFALAACTSTANTTAASNDAATDAASDTTHTEAYITQRINEIYDFIIADSTLQISVIEKDHRFMSTSFNALQDKALEIAQKNDDVIIDADHWICGQDWTRPTMTISKISDITDSSAVVRIKLVLDIDPLNPKIETVKLPLVWERGNWYVDDMIQTWMSQENSERQWLENYVTKNGK